MSFLTKSSAPSTIRLSGLTIKSISGERRQTMTLQEKVLYHQIYPLKLGTDVAAQVIATVLFWDHLLLAAILVMFIPPIVASSLIIPTLDMTRIKNSAVGRYLKRS